MSIMIALLAERPAVAAIAHAPGCDRTANPLQCRDASIIGKTIRRGKGDIMPDAVGTFLKAVESAAIETCDAWAPDCVLDATVPNWRFHRRGADAIRREYSGWFADAGRFDRLRR